MTGRLSTAAIVGGLTAFGCMALAAIILVGDTQDAMQRIGLFFGFIGIVIPTLLGMLRSDQAAKQTNGSLDERIEAALLRAQSARRRTDIVPPEYANPDSPVE